MRSIVYLAGGLVLATAVTGWADTTLIYNEGAEAFTVRIRPGEIRIDDSGERWQLYVREEGAIYSVNPDNDSYVRMDADIAGQIRAQMRNLRERMEKKLQELPPQQREIARTALAAQIPGLGKAGEVTVDTTGDTDMVAGHECEVVQLIRGGVAQESLCIADAQDLGLSGEEFATVEAMFGLMQTMLAGTGLEYVGLPYLKLAGMPIRYQDALSQKQRTLSRVSHDQLSDLVFAIPPGYQAQNSPAAPGQGPPQPPVSD